MSPHRYHQFARFLDLNGSDINCDLHLHTNRTDGKADINTIIRHAVHRGLNRIAFTEHVRRDSNWFQEFACKVREERKSYKEIEILVGCEAKTLDTQGTLDVTDEILAECDIVLGCVHRFPDNRGGYLDLSTLSQEEFAQVEFELALGLLGGAPIDILAHPGGMYFKRYNSDLPNPMMKKVLEKSLEQKIAVEINTSYLGNFPIFLKLCAEINPYISIGSDLHCLDQIGKCRDQLKAYGIGAT